MLRVFALPFFVVELVCAYFFIHAYGFLNLVFETAFTAIIGAILMSKMGFLTQFSRLTFLSSREILSELGVAVGGFLLFLPGIFTDILGAVVAVWAMLKQTSKTQPTFYENHQQTPKNSHYDDVIDVEVIEEKR